MSEDDQIFCQCDSLRPSHAPQDSQLMYFFSYLWLLVCIGQDELVHCPKKQPEKNPSLQFLRMFGFMIVHYSVLTSVTPRGGEVAHAHITMFKSTPWRTRAQKHTMGQKSTSTRPQKYKSKIQQSAAVSCCRVPQRTSPRVPASLRRDLRHPGQPAIEGLGVALVLVLQFSFVVALVDVLEAVEIYCICHCLREVHACQSCASLALFVTPTHPPTSPITSKSWTLS